MTSSGHDNKAEDFLRKASLAESAGARAKYATRGLERVGDDRTLNAMLLRQLYLSHMESGRFEKASEIARGAVELGVLADVACQDLARAYLGLGMHQQAVEQLRRATRIGPASRRAFHLWTLGSVLHFRGDHRGAMVALERAARWGTTARPLYEAQLRPRRARRASGGSPRGDALSRGVPAAHRDRPRRAAGWIDVRDRSGAQSLTSSWRAKLMHGQRPQSRMYSAR
jgi:tetratricopeptide (TPR) repeat protein